MKKITLYGGGGHCYAVIEIIKSLGEYLPTVIYDDAPALEHILDIPMRGFDKQDLTQNPLCISIGNNKIRKMIREQFDTVYPSFCHASAVIMPSASIGHGVLVHPNAVVDAAVSLGNFCIVNNNATLSHNVSVGDYAHIAINTAVAGGVEIGEGTLVGAGSVILPELKIGKWVTIGAGAVITKDLPDYAVVYGNPGSINSYNKP